MARTQPTAVTPSFTGATVTPAAPDATGDILDPGVTLVVTNGSGSSITVTIDVTATDTSLSLPDTGGSVAAGATKVFEIPSKRLAAQPSDAAVGPGRVLVNYSAVASVTRYVLTG